MHKYLCSLRHSHQVPQSLLHQLLWSQTASGETWYKNWKITSKQNLTGLAFQTSILHRNRWLLSSVYPVPNVVASMLRASSRRTGLLKLESVRASLPSVAIALKAWHAFATRVLGVRSDSTLAPMSEDHVCTSASVFGSPKTAAKLHLPPAVNLRVSQDLDQMAWPGDQTDCNWHTEEEFPLHRWSVQG